MKLALQTKPFLFEPAHYHDTDDRGFFSLLVQQPSGIKSQTSHALSHMPQVIQGLDQTKDTWISQAEFFKKNRRVVNLWRLGLLFVDLDTYRTPLANCTPDALLYLLENFCREEGIPQPSLVVYSGRGLQVKWLLDKPIPRATLPRWNACQRVLVDRLAEFGADPAAKDASRVLRLVNTVNTKSGQVCRLLHVTERLGEPLRYDFEDLADALLPIARFELESAQKARLAARAGQTLSLVDGGRKTGLRSFSGRQLAWHRLDDLRKLAELRGGVPEGERMVSLFWRVNFLLLSGATNQVQMFYEAKALAAEIDPRWMYHQSELGTLYRKAKAYEAGERIEFNGRSYPALYTPKNETLINQFQITDDEQRQLKTIITPSIARDRHNERLRKYQQEKRQAAGAVSRDQYLGQAQSKAEQAKALRDKGLSIRNIAEQMGVSVGSVAGYLKN